MPVDNNYVILDDDGDNEAGDAPTDVTPAGLVVRPVFASPVAIDANNIAFIRSFLREVGGVPDIILDGGSWAGLIVYVSGRFS